MPQKISFLNVRLLPSSRARRRVVVSSVSGAAPCRSCRPACCLYEYTPCIEQLYCDLEALIGELSHGHWIHGCLGGCVLMYRVCGTSHVAPEPRQSAIICKPRSVVRYVGEQRAARSLHQLATRHGLAGPPLSFSSSVCFLFFFDHHTSSRNPQSTPLVSPLCR